MNGARGRTGILASVVAFVLIALTGFIYRNEGETPNTAGVSSSTQPSGACAADAKVCPDGSAVARTGAGCSFATCPFPNIEVSTGSTTLSFVLPSGYTKNGDAYPSGTTIATYEQLAGAASSSSITIKAFAIPAGETGTQVMLEQTTFDPSGLTATSSSEFKDVQLGKNEFSAILVGRFEGTVQSAYYLESGDTLFRFDIREAGAQDWADQNLDTDTLSQHQAFQQMLATLDVRTVP